MIGTIIQDIGFQNIPGSAGPLVAYDAAANQYIPAAATWTISNTDGAIIPSNSAYVSGIVLPADVGQGLSGERRVLLSGVINSTDPVFANLFASGERIPGEYFLKDNGELVLGAPEGMLPVYCGYLTASGNFIFRPQAPDYRGHHHTAYKLDNDLWTTSGSGYTYADVTTADNTQTVNDATALQILTALPVSAVSLVKDSTILQRGTDYTISDDGTLWLASSAYSASANYYLCGLYPLVTTDADIRSIALASGNNTISITKAYGTVYLDNTYPVISSSNATGTCISEITKSGIKTAPVVNSIIAGAGTSITGNNGTYTISNTLIASTLIDFQTISANNVLIGGNSTDALITFPAATGSSIIGIARIPAASGDLSFKVFLYVDSASAALLSTTNPTCSVVKIHRNTGDTNTNILTKSAAESGYFEAQSTPGSGDFGVCALTTAEYTANGNDLITVTISCSSALSTSLKVYAAGILLV